MPGFVRLTDDDITRIARFMKLTEFDFIQNYTRLRPRRDGLALNDKSSGECIFLDGNDCLINDVKPEQCIGFPNTWNFKGWRQSCRATPVVIDDRSSEMHTPSSGT